MLIANTTTHLQSHPAHRLIHLTQCLLVAVALSTNNTPLCLSGIARHSCYGQVHFPTTYAYT